MLERSLPELSEAIRRRRADPFVLDPANVLRFDLVDALRDIVAADPAPRRRSNASAIRSSPCWRPSCWRRRATEGEPEALARRLADHLRLGVVGEEELVDLVTDCGLLRAAATRLEGLDEEPVLQLAATSPRRRPARALYVLSLALGELETWSGTVLTSSRSRVHGVLLRPVAHWRACGPGPSSSAEPRRCDSSGIHRARSPG